MATLQAKTTIQAEQKKAVLLISPDEPDQEVLRGVFEEQSWTLFSSPSCGPALRLLREVDIPVVMTEQELPVGDWRDVLEIMHLLPHRPLVIVTSRHADERLWAEALNLGAYDVLAKPFVKEQIVRAVGLAWLHWRDRE